MNNVTITPEIIAEHGFTNEEYDYILRILGRTPTWVELGIFSVMWSEHASYKNSIKLLKTLPREGGAMLAKAGEENAGVVDIGDDLAICFKIESHNHPSAVEPYHGAATGVGGILRDIFTMGARPIAALNSLRFGDPKSPVVKHLISEVVHGIADYGNCFGVPTVGGEIYFEDSYEGNPLVNAMAVGIVEHGQIAKSAAKGVGNLVVYVGAKTGRDGIHGATFASVDLSDESEEKRTAVQVGDPFMEKLLLEATLEVIRKDLVVGIQDMGAAGLTCSSSEMAGKAGVGITMEIDKVPQREHGMTPYEIMLSESQERMLLVVKPADIDEIMAIFHKWDLDASVVGEVRDDGKLRIIYQGDTVAEIPAEYLILGGKAPVYTRETTRPEYLDKVQALDPSTLPHPQDLGQVLLKLLSSPNIASKRSVFRQYDHMVQINTHTEPGADAAVVAIKGTKKAIALSTDCNGRYCYLDPYNGARIAVAEAARNVVSVGGKPLAITNCLNFGNPYKPEVYWTMEQAVKGMGDACRALNTPVTGGNVSLYNENPEGAIYPTPVIGMLGLIEDIDKAIDHRFKAPGNLIVLLGGFETELGGSEYLKQIHGVIGGKLPVLNMDREKALHEAMLELIDKQMLKSAHDISDGGMLCAIAESAIAGGLGANLQFDAGLQVVSTYFAEGNSKMITSILKEDLQEVIRIAEAYGLSCLVLGEVTADATLRVNNDIKLGLNQIREAWANTITI